MEETVRIKYGVTLKAQTYKNVRKYFHTKLHGKTNTDHILIKARWLIKKDPVREMSNTPFLRDMEVRCTFIIHDRDLSEFDDTCIYNNIICKTDSPLGQ